MLVATFTRSSKRSRSVIVYSEGRFTVDLKEEITPAAIVNLAAKRHIDWTHDAMRQWVRSLARDAGHPAPARTLTWPWRRREG